MGKPEFVDWEGLRIYDDLSVKYINEQISRCMKDAQVVPYSGLPQPDSSNLGFVYLVTEAFSADNRFLASGKNHGAGTYVHVIKYENEYKLAVLVEVIDGEFINKTIPFPHAATAQQTVGGIKAGDSLENLTLGEILSKLLTLDLEVFAQSITLNYADLSMLELDEVDIDATVLPVDTSNKTVTWTSGNPVVADVTQDGYVIAKTPGETYIIAKTSNGLEAMCRITVLKVNIENYIKKNKVPAFVMNANGYYIGQYAELTGDNIDPHAVGFYTEDDRIGYQLQSETYDDDHLPQVIITQKAKIKSVYQYDDDFSHSWHKVQDGPSGMYFIQGPITVINGERFNTYTWNEEIQGGSLYTAASWRFELEVE